MLINITRQAGVSLLESMIALLVISIGLLGIAALQINAMQQNSSAYWQTQAVLMAHNMADRIRANRIERLNYITIDTSSAHDKDCKATPCTSTEMIEADATDWKALVETLPSGRGIIRAPEDNQIDVVVMWDDEGTGASGIDCGNDPETDLTCYTVTMSSL